MSESKPAESVWDYPRPPRVEKSSDRVLVIQDGKTLIDTTDSVRVLETSHPPTYYLPIDGFLSGALLPTAGASMCEFKGMANYYDVVIGGWTAERAAWAYKNPQPGFELLRGMVALYPGRFEFCSVNGEKVLAQEGDFYGGWINSWITGPFKGGPLTMGW
jgi:uncharacterized protein (DUF427 family)